MKVFYDVLTDLHTISSRKYHQLPVRMHNFRENFMQNTHKCTWTCIFAENFQRKLLQCLWTLIVKQSHEWVQTYTHSTDTLPIMISVYWKLNQPCQGCLPRASYFARSAYPDWQTVDWDEARESSVHVYVTSVKILGLCIAGFSAFIRPWKFLLGNLRRLWLRSRDHLGRSRR